MFRLTKFAVPFEFFPRLQQYSSRLSPFHFPDVPVLTPCLVEIYPIRASVLELVCCLSAISILCEKAQCYHLFSSIAPMQNKYFCTRNSYRKDLALGIFSQPYAVFNVHTLHMKKVSGNISGEFLCYSRQNTVAGYWPKRPDFPNCNFSDFYPCK